MTLPVTCVEAGRWDGRRANEQMRPSPQAADPSLRRVKRAAANRAASAGVVARADQGEVWREVDERLTKHSVDSRSAALSDLYDSRRGVLGELVRAVRPVKDRVGAVACIAGTPVALDVVSRRPRVRRAAAATGQGYALDALGSDDGEPDQEHAEDFLNGALDAPRMPVATPGLGSGTAIATQQILGSGLEYGGELLQLCAFPADGNDTICRASPVRAFGGAAAFNGVPRSA